MSDPIEDTARDILASQGAGRLAGHTSETPADVVDTTRHVYNANGIGTSVGKFLRESAQDGVIGGLGNSLDAIGSTGTLGSAAILGALGYGGGKLLGKATDYLGLTEEAEDKLGTRLGIAGLLGGAYTGYQHTKYASFGTELDRILRTLPYSDRQVVEKALDHTTDADKLNFTRIAAQIGTGAAVAWLLHKLGVGTAGTVLGGISGGILGGAVHDTASAWSQGIIGPAFSF